MEKLLRLINNCGCEITIGINEHRNCYQKIKQYLEDIESLSNESLQIDDEIMKKMIELDTIIIIQFYPITPVGFYRVFHFDLSKAIDQCLGILTKLNREGVKIK